jgi:NAD-dependent dihydropyrimidine dehydrogenase PreA subunit
MVKTSKEFPGVEWVEKTGDFIKINEQKCIGCANCVKVCLAGCFEMVNLKAKIKSLENCMECASCWYVCEPEAIDFSWPSGGTGFRSDWG